MPEHRKSGIDVLGDISWGSHFCSFYETKQDLLDTLVPYFKAGLESKEFCIWVVSNSALITVEEAKEALEQEIPHLDQHISEGNIEIFKEEDWYLKENEFDLERMSNAWDEKLKRALALGYEGIRVSGDTFWLKENDWKDFTAYEKQLNDSITGQRMTALCTYSLSKSKATEILDVIQEHQFAIARRQGEWQVIETPELVQAKAEIKRLNEELQRLQGRSIKPSLVWKYIVAVFSASAAIAITVWLRMEVGQQATPIVATLICAIMFSAWFGGIGPGLVTFAFCFLGFDYFFVSPVNSLAVAINEIPRLIVFMLSAFFVGSLSVAQRNISESLRKARDVLNETVQKLRQANTALQEEIVERKHTEEELKKEKEILAKIFNNIPVMIGFVGDDGSVKLVNPEWERTIGWTLKELQEQNVNIFAEAYPDLLYRQEVLDFVAASTGEWMDLKIKVRDGRVIDAACAVIRLSDGTKVAIAQDITRRKQTEDALRRSEDRIRLIIDTIPIMAWSISPDGTPDFVNKQWKDYTGISKEEQMKNPNQPIHPEDIPHVMKNWEKGLAAGKLVEDEMRVRRADGEYRWFLVRTDPLRDDKGNIIKWYGVAIDIEDSKRAEDELRLAYQRLSYHVENTPLAVIEFDKELFIRRWSKHAEDIFGWKESEALGKNIYDPSFPIICEEDIQAVNNTIVQLLSGSADRNLSLNCNYTKDGNSIYCEWYNSVLKDEHGNVVTILSLVHNVTERKKAEERIKQSEAHLAAAQQLAKMGSWDFDIKADKLTWSEELYNVFGADKQTFKETHGSFLTLVDKEDREFALQTSRHTQQTGEPFTIEYHITTAKGEKRIIHERGYGQTDDTAKVVRLFGTAQDITERKKAEEALQQSYQEIRRLTEHLQKIREEERTSIAREIHDELGQQLTAIKMDVAWIDKQTPEETADIKRKLKNIIELLDGSNLSIRRILSELRPGVLDDHGLLEAVEWLGRQFTETTSIPVKFTTPEKDIKVPEQIATCIFRVCQEAFTNIARYSHAKNVSITIKIIEENIILIIEDDGIGFDPGSIENKKSFGILGMRERVHSLGGKFDLVSSPEKGTKITVSLPYKA